jgi:hypothetical protein
MGPGGTTLVKEPRIVWPDSFAPEPDSRIWFTASRIHPGPNPSTFCLLLEFRNPS